MAELKIKIEMILNSNTMSKKMDIMCNLSHSARTSTNVKSNVEILMALLMNFSCQNAQVR